MKVWIQYPTRNPTQPYDWLVYNADTGKLVEKLLAFDISVHAAMTSAVRLTYHDGRTEMAELVAEPAQPTRERVEFSLRHTYDQASATTEFDLVAQRISGGGHSIVTRITDHEYMLAKDPDGLVGDRIKLLARDMGQFLMRDLLASHGITRPVAMVKGNRYWLGGQMNGTAQQPTPQTKAPFVPVPGNGSFGGRQPAPAKCGECGGTGQWENPVSGKRSPCSRGCKP